jgi:hypothetical protein
MIKFSKKSLLLFISAIAMAAFAMPSLASAATFDGVGAHTLTSSSLGFTAGAPLNGGSDCASSVFQVNVPAGGASATVTGATFSGCVGTDALNGIPADVTATNFPWEITRTGVGTGLIDGIHIVVNFTAAATIVTLSGNLPVAINNTTHTITFTNATGLTATSGGASASTVVNGDFRDDQNSLGIT